MKLRILGHPVHPMLCALPIGLFVSVMCWDTLYLLTQQEHWYQIAYWSLSLGLITAIGASLTGLIDFMEFVEKTEPGSKGLKVGLWHMVIMSLVVFIFLCAWLMRGGFEYATLPKPSMISIGLSFLGGVCLTIGGWFGGELVFKYKAGHTNN